MNILYYPGTDTQKCTLVENVLKTFPYSYAILSLDDIEQKIGYLMKLDGYQKEAIDENKQMHDMDLMIFHHLDDEQIHAISKALRDQQVHVERKAMVTKHNKDWTLIALLNEIEEEHAYFMKYDEIKKHLVEFNQMDEHAYTADSWKPYQSSLIQAYILLQENEQPALELLLSSIEKILNAKQNLVSKT